MTLNNYQQATVQTVVVHKLMSGMDNKISQLQLVIKKAIQSDHIELPLVNIIDELGDLLWYIPKLARELNIDLDDIAMVLASRMEQNDIKPANERKPNDSPKRIM